MFIPFKLFRTMTGHLADNGVRHAFDKKLGGRKVLQIVNPQIGNSSQIPDSPEPLADVPGVRFLKFFNFLKAGVWTRRKQIFVISAGRKLPERLNREFRQRQPVRAAILAVFLRQVNIGEFNLKLNFLPFSGENRRFSESRTSR